MSTIPLHIQRRFDRRSAARFVRPVALVSPKSGGGARSGKEHSPDLTPVRDISLTPKQTKKPAA
jgi:hypothetical protein